MDPSNEEVEQDLSHIHWSWPEAIAANPEKSLANPDLAMDYFAFSPFWDSKSNNNVLRTQRRIENPGYGHREEKVELTAFRSGFEYIIAHSAPPEMFIIHKREVQSDGSRDKVSGIWWIMREKVYPTPTMYEVVSARLQNASYLVSKTFSTLSALHPPSNPRATNQWRSLPPDASSTSNDINVKAAQVEGDLDGDVEMGEASASASASDPQRPQMQNRTSVNNDDAAKTTSAAKSNINNTVKTSSVQPQQPDWHLFHALQTTRQSLAELNDLSRSAPPPPPVQADSTANGGGQGRTKLKIGPKGHGQSVSLMGTPGGGGGGGVGGRLGGSSVGGGTPMSMSIGMPTVFSRGAGGVGVGTPGSASANG